MDSSGGTPRNLQEEIGKVSAFDLPEQEAFLNLLRTHAELAGEFATLFKEFGLSEPQYNALRIVAAAGARGIRSETIGVQMIARDPERFVAMIGVNTWVRVSLRATGLSARDLRKTSTSDGCIIGSETCFPSRSVSICRP